ncbi:hypothetical protein GPJ56_005384 [Histomonas meleagridis]|uniref:uncharacterized protein n=1 Tax=Histomonas meleagridis TaxID=135588 RepID=UPI00355ACC56|nr:hypothetical protein GPJ56_005384 [Histomonas meleagridis]KAH0803568.1 hypothetical protein GO595_003619 [Histomonas meleagridis]
MDDEYEDNDSKQNNMETGRVARYFIYKNREKQAVRKIQIRPILDEFREKSRRKRIDPIESTNDLLNKTMGLNLVQGLAPDEKPSQSSKFFLVRRQKYPDNVPIPFTPHQKKEYGLLVFCFFVVQYKGNQLDLEQLGQVLQNSNVPLDSPDFGKWPEIMHKWASQDYFKLKKIDDENASNTNRSVTLGPRFYAEFGVNTLHSMANELVTGEIEEENEEEAKSEGSSSETEEEEKGPPKRMATRGQQRRMRRNVSEDDELESDSIEE